MTTQKVVFKEYNDTDKELYGIFELESEYLSIISLFEALSDEQLQKLKKTINRELASRKLKNKLNTEFLRERGD